MRAHVPAEFMVDESVRAAMAKWPGVPAVYGWLSLDEHGHWRLRDEPITHPGLIGFINRNYERDEAGCWFFQNGPQRGYVRLDYTPWILHVDTEDMLRTHTGRIVESVHGAWIDDEGNLLLETEAGIGLVDSDALPRISDWLTDETEETETSRPGGVAETSDAGTCLHFGRGRFPLRHIARERVPERFGFVPDPQPRTRSE